MERRYELRLQQMLAQAEVSPELMQGLLKRLDAFAGPWDRSQNRQHFRSDERQRPAVLFEAHT